MNLFSIARKNNGAIIWSQDQIDYIIREYNTHHSTTIIANQFNTSTQAIRTVLRKNNVEVLSIAELKHLEYPRNSCYFENIDSADKAYWLGFLYADGYISKNGEIRINLMKEDEQHLYKFLAAIDAINNTIKYSRKLTETKIYEQAYCNLRDIKMVNDLADKGCVNNKSLILKFPYNKLRSDLYSHFIRGYIDGDGSINYTCFGNAKTPNYRLSIAGTEDMLTAIKNILNKNNLALEDRKTFYCLTICGNKQLEGIFNYVYQDSYDAIELSRKRQIYNNFLLQRFGGEPVNTGCE